MAERISSPTISMRERPSTVSGPEDRLPKWVVVSLLLHLFLIACLLVIPMLPSKVEPIPVYTVDLVGGEKIGAANLGTQLTPPPKPKPREPQVEKSPPPPEPKREVKKEEPAKPKKAKAKPEEKKPALEEKVVLREKAKPKPPKPAPPKETKNKAKEVAKSEDASLESVRERLLQSAVERAKARTEGAEKTSKEEPLSTGSGEGIGAAALGAGGRGGPGVVKGIDFIIYQNRILSTIKANWAWVGQRSSLKVVVHFGIKDTGEIVKLRIVQPSGDPSYDESVLRAVKKSSPLPAPPENYQSDFADVQLTFRPQDLGA